MKAPAFDVNKEIDYVCTHSYTKGQFCLSAFKGNKIYDGFKLITTTTGAAYAVAAVDFIFCEEKERKIWNI